MKRVLVLLLLSAGLLASRSGFAQNSGGNGGPCTGPGCGPCTPGPCSTCCVNPGPTLPPSDYLWVECWDDNNCNTDCGTCVRYQIRNMYSCKCITSVTGHCSTVQQYKICNVTRHLDGESDCAWTVSQHDPDIGGCYTAGPGGSNWTLTPTTGCKVCQG